MTMRKIFVLALLIISVNAFAQTFGTKDSTYKKVTFPERYTAQINVVYTTVSDWQGKMDKGGRHGKFEKEKNKEVDNDIISFLVSIKSLELK